ncbi:DNA polymerase beta domain protein region [Desulfonatronospira thiodismutans ASO3-1]|uniref:DNA polymerase beta domain protein region n=2 Tax=Desulfonatronospira thiodismutans TaxID=488939 RepID=D6SK31_9BACT|nr:DNA polymerase beta domain protein region [Desulfonatronospira thiodismutans ASO3-1]
MRSHHFKQVNTRGIMNNLITATKQFFDASSEDILLIFVFGSAAVNRLTSESDVDVALLFSCTPEYFQILKIKAELAAAVGREVDLVILNDSSPIIRMQVLKNGILLKKFSSAAYSEFVVRTVKEYDDLKRKRKEAEDRLLQGRIYA